ncbi:MAG: hypothetical protein CVU84_15015 [Firmicutes bacterium HGW-Firmicutes-1]|jgi:hypothetical protein|nr:MAG: hypothetical protein CVU84_15015 [Firmicutes bacterium HGW-Firmicutes-1]
MASMFFYKNTPYLPINEISIIGAFNKFDPKATPLRKEKDGWYVEIDLAKGEHQYKFVINNVLRLNDPTASRYLPDEIGEVWSMADVNSKRELITSEAKEPFYLMNHVITNRKVDFIEEARYKNNLSLSMDKTVFAGFEFGAITGIHTITAIWFTPQLFMHHIADHVIEVMEGDENNAAEVWFWIDLEDKTREYPHGIWYVKLLADGEFVMEDKFSIGTGGTYVATNKGILVNRSFDNSN